MLITQFHLTNFKNIQTKWKGTIPLYFPPHYSTLLSSLFKLPNKPLRFPGSNSSNHPLELYPKNHPPSNHRSGTKTSFHCRSCGLNYPAYQKNISFFVLKIIWKYTRYAHIYHPWLLRFLHVCVYIFTMLSRYTSQGNIEIRHM